VMLASLVPGAPAEHAARTVAMRQSRTAVGPPRRSKVTRQPIPQRLWVTFPVEQQQQVLSALTRVVAQQLAKPPDVKEVTHERS
jgi:hypothetical protein